MKMPESVYRLLKDAQQRAGATKGVSPGGRRIDEWGSNKRAQSRAGWAVACATARIHA